VVGVARGFATPLGRQLLAGLPELVGTPIAAAAPFGLITIPQVRQAATVARPFVHGDRVIAPRLGLTIPIAQGLKPKVDEDDVSFSAEGGGFASLIFAISDLAYTPKSVRHSFDTFEQALKRPLDDDQTVSVVVKAGSAQTPVGKAVERVWQVDDTPIHGRLLLVPICRGTGMLVIGEGYGSDATRALLDRVIADVRVLATGSPICAELDP
jgi:hypothetical protein